MALLPLINSRRDSSFDSWSPDNTVDMHEANEAFQVSIILEEFEDCFLGETFEDSIEFRMPERIQLIPSIQPIGP
jgi:hypothetical protein